MKRDTLCRRNYAIIQGRNHEEDSLGLDRQD